MPIKVEKIERPVRLRRSCHAVPGSNPRMLEKAAGLPADQVFLDLEDSVAPTEKSDESRNHVIHALNTFTYQAKTRVVRVNDVTTKYAYRDLIGVVEGAGQNLECIMIPKVESAEHVTFVDRLITQIEEYHDWEVGRIGIEAQIENGEGILNLKEIAWASPRLEALIFGPGDFSAAMHMPELTVGAINPDYPGDIWHHVNFSILATARAAGVDAIDGPYAQIKDEDGLREVAKRTRLMGFDGKWSLHPGQIGPLNEIYSPPPAQYQKAEQILEAYKYATEVERKGAVMFGDEMIDEATRKMAEQYVVKGRLIGLERGPAWQPPVAATA